MTQPHKNTSQALILLEQEPVFSRQHARVTGAIPKFSDPKWDCSLLEGSPTIRKSESTLHFDGLVGDWLVVGKVFAFASMHPESHILRTHGIYLVDSPRRVRTVQEKIYVLRRMQNWSATCLNSKHLNKWSVSDIEKFISSNDASNSRKKTQSLTKQLPLISPLCPETLAVNNLRAPKSKRPRGLTTPPIAPQDFWALIRACWYYIDALGPKIVRAYKIVQQHQQSITDNTESKRRTTKELDNLLANYLDNPETVIPLQDGLATGRTPGDVNWQALAELVWKRRNSAQKFYETTGHREYPAQRRAAVMKAIRKGKRTCRGQFPFQISPMLNDSPRLQNAIPGFSQASLNAELVRLRTASLIFVTIMSMMRISEVSSIRKGSIGQNFGAPSVKATLWKHRDGHGVPAEWWITEPVVQTIQLLEELVGDDELIFPNREVSGKAMSSVHNIRKFINYINQNASQLGLEVISDSQIRPHRFRRTMSILTANEPDGEIALGISLKHNSIRALSNAVTSGYGAPDSAWAKEMKLDIQAANAGKLVSQWASITSKNAQVSGPGSAQFQKSLQQVRSRVKKGDDRVLRELLRDEFSELRLGTLNHCLGDPNVAECLKNSNAESDATEPIAALCSPSTCRNSVITEEHHAVWLAEEAELRKLLKDKRMASRHRQQLESELSEIQSVTKSFKSLPKGTPNGR
ncbi:hypothetical protein [Corynebacterium flavescens]|uniref:hypothetical protein n=1 Tax=Corynebacterium flavescens TaxID=28028 RepID=UPI00264A4869|nr:hypothetical protein [Corynebacterium flavescens]MDN6822940.1 site-specific integrase [Corynebacterium flavescens]